MCLSTLSTTLDSIAVSTTVASSEQNSYQYYGVILYY